MTILNKSNLAEGNRAFRVGELSEAIRHYVQSILDTPELGKIVAGNLALARQKYRASRLGLEKQRVAVCGWELAHNAAERVYDLAKLYENFAEVEIIGSIFPQWGREIWEPIRNLNISIHSFVVEDENLFIEQAVKLVVEHPYDIIHLSTPRIPNIFVGILYKLIWDAKVLMDIAEETITFEDEVAAISVEDYLEQHGRLPELKDLCGKDWIKISVGLAREFDGITVSSSVLQQRHGGEIISQSRDGNIFNLLPELKNKKYDKFGIPKDKTNFNIFNKTERLAVFCEKMAVPIFSLVDIFQKYNEVLSGNSIDSLTRLRPIITTDCKTIKYTSSKKIPQIEKVLSYELKGSPCRVFHEFDVNSQDQFINALFAEKILAFQAANVKVSIIMPTYNRANVIEKALNSVIKQTHENWELLIVDDGSTDETLMVLQVYAQESRIKLIQGEHKGVSSARNQGLKHATGQYIFYLDSDNTWSPLYLQMMVMMFLYSKRKTGYCAIALIDETKKIIGYRGEPFNWNHCLQANYVDLNAFAHERCLLQKYGNFDENLRRMVDWDLILRLTKENPPFYAPFIGCYYFESKKDLQRITLSEPLSFQKVVRIKNSISSNNALEVSKALKLNFAIKIPAPYEQRLEWGDFHFADSLRIALENMGHTVVLDFYGKWYERPANADDVVIVIRGLTAYKPSRGPINILWNISHPDQVSFQEYESFDHVYVASLSYASFLGTFLKCPVASLLQCSDPNRFYYKEPDFPKKEKILFVGNSRDEYRPIVKKAIDAKQDIEIYGTRWGQFVDTDYIHGENIPNKELREYYTSYGTVLNDHWESMRQFGFISNRIFDVLAAGGGLISDSLPSISRLFGDAVVQIGDDESFEDALKRLRTQKKFDNQKRIISDQICKYHSFDRRAQTIYSQILARLGLPNIYPVEEEVLLSDESNLPRRKVGMILQNGPQRPTSSAYIRLIAPLTTEYANSTVEIILLDDVYDPKLLSCSALIVQRVAITDMQSADWLLTIVRQHSIALYVDTDDAFSLLPDEHPEIDRYRPLDIVLRHIMRSASHVWFSTATLASLYRKDYHTGSVVENTLDPRIWRNYRKPQPRAALAPKFSILYMGTATHDSDFALVLPVFDALAKTKGLCFEVIVIGALSNPPVREWLKVVSVPPGMSNYPKFARWLTNSGSYDIGIAPLADNAFNNCKSDIKFLDYTALGIPTICSRGRAYQTLADAGLVLACDNTTDQWLRALSMAMENRELMLNMVNRAWDYLWRHRSVSAAARHMLCHLANPNQPEQTSELRYPITSLGTSNRIAVCIHLYYINRWTVIRPFLNNITDGFDLYVSCVEGQSKEVNKLVKKDFPDAIVSSYPNAGMDVLPFLRMNHDYALWSYDAVLKLHTKNDKTEDGDTIGKLYLDALLGSRRLVNYILEQLLSGHRIGMMGPEILYRSASKLMYNNNNGVRRIIDALKVDYPVNEYGFFAGTMFWINGALLRNLATHINDICSLSYEYNGKSATGGDGEFAHAMERFFGALPCFGNMAIGVSYVRTLDGKHEHLRRVGDGELLKNIIFRNGSTAHLLRYKNLSSWAEICRKSGYFDNHYYITHANSSIPISMDPIVHFILYGDDLCLDPSPKFSVSFYKQQNGDVVRSRIPTLIHYLIRGQKEGRLPLPVKSEFLAV